METEEVQSRFREGVGCKEIKGGGRGKKKGNYFHLPKKNLFSAFVSYLLPFPRKQMQSEVDVHLYTARTGYTLGGRSGFGCSRIPILTLEPLSSSSSSCPRPPPRGRNKLKRRLQLDIFFLPAVKNDMRKRDKHAYLLEGEKK